MTHPLLAPADQTDQQPQQPPGFDPSSAIAAVEQGLLSFLSMPMQQKLDGLPLQQLPQTFAPQGSPADASSLDPFQLIAPVVNGLGSLGNGQFSGVDPTQILSGVSSAFDGTAMPLQQARGSVSHDWKGGANTAADAKTHAAVANGAEVATQADGLRQNLSDSASEVAQARKRLIDIVDEFQAKMAAVDLSTPEGKAAAIAAANEANTESTAVMKDVQGKLGVQAQQAAAIGAPVQVANAPGGSTAGGPTNPLKGLAGLDPTGVLDTVVSDPRMTPKGLAGNFMDLIFLPSTLSEMNGNLKATNATMSRTNSIMTGLGETMVTTNGTIGKTNSIMSGLGTTIGATNSIMTGLGNTLGTTNDRMATLNGSMGTLHGDMTGLSGDMRGLSGDMGTLHNDMTGLSGDMGNLSDGMGDLNDGMGTLHDDMGGLSEDMNGLGDDMGTLHDDMGGLSDKLGTTNEEMQELNDTIPGPVDLPDPTNIDGGPDTPGVPW
jgi:X-X-X-Leu-X-X-Gly heptad repeat protein